MPKRKSTANAVLFLISSCFALHPFDAPLSSSFAGGAFDEVPSDVPLP
tara:strand:- start:97 stop:240 length:144 start_codon:yes stop_codon:yes gene_type:complete